MTDDDVRFLEVTRGRSPPEKRGGAKTHVERRGRGGRRRRGVRAARGPVRAGIVRAERRGGRGLGLVRAPASGHAPRGRRRGGLLEGVAEVVAPARAAARAGLGVRVRRALLLERVVRQRDVPSDSATPACCRSRTTRKNQTEKARDGVRRGARGDAVAVARPPIAAPRLRRRTRRWGRPRGARVDESMEAGARDRSERARVCSDGKGLYV